MTKATEVTAAAAIEAAEALYVNQRTGAWYDPTGEESSVARLLVEVAKAQIAEINALRTIIDAAMSDKSGNMDRVYKILEKAFEV